MPERETGEIIYQTAEIDRILRHYVDSYEVEARVLDWWFDAHKREVVMRLHVLPDPNEAPAPEAV